MTMAGESDYEDMADTVHELVAEYPFITHFVINPLDAIRANKPILAEEESGDLYFEIDGYRVYLEETCPTGKLGACVPDNKLGQA